MELEDGTSIGGLLKQLQIPPKETKSVFVNSVIRELSYVLRDNDELGIFSPIGGGRN
jgi:sulfur carrier protein ThiS